MQGQRAKPVAKAPVVAAEATEAQVEKTISASQMSFDNQVDQLNKIIELLKLEAQYSPNEADLTVAGLQARLNGLKTANSGVINGYTQWSNSRLQRDNQLYNPVTGLVATALAVKKYVKSVFGAGSPQFKQVSGLEFKTLPG
jgi:hypothetical protein